MFQAFEGVKELAAKSVEEFTQEDVSRGVDSGRDAHTLLEI